MFMASQRSRADQGDGKAYYSIEEVRARGARKTFSTRSCRILVERNISLCFYFALGYN